MEIDYQSQVLRTKDYDATKIDRIIHHDLTISISNFRCSEVIEGYCKIMVYFIRIVIQDNRGLGSASQALFRCSPDVVCDQVTVQRNIIIKDKST
jgi:hypothetical protein